MVAQQLTPHYASQERLRGEAATVASDVYSLGLILFELCSGGAPFPHQASVVGMAERAAGHTTSSSLPAAATAESAGRRGVSLDKLRRQLSGDLASICAKALAFSPEARYLTVGDLAADLRRYLAGEPVEAHAASFGYRASRFVRRYAGRLALAAAVFVSLSGAAVYSWRQAEKARVVAERSESTSLFLTSILSSAGRDPTKITLREAIDLAESSLAGLREHDKALASDIELAFSMAATPEKRRDEETASRALALARASGDVSREVPALAMLGHQSYLRGQPDAAWRQSTDAIELWKRNRSAFSPLRSMWILGVAGINMTYTRPFDMAAREPLTGCLALAEQAPWVPVETKLRCLDGMVVSLLFGSQEYDKALPLAEEAVRLRRKTPGDKGGLTESLQRLGLNYRFLGRYGEDEQAQREAYRLIVETWGADTLLAANFGAVWATALGGVGNPEEGLRQAEAALAIYRRQYPKRASLLLWTPLSAAMANACRLGRYGLCEAYSREALETLGAQPSANDMRVGTAQGYLGLALAHLDRGSEAKPLLEAALQALREQKRNPPHRPAMEAALAKLQ